MDGRQLRTLRRRLNLTQGEVAREAGLHQPALSAIEHGRRGSPAARQRVLAAIRRLARPSAALDTNTRAAVKETLTAHGAHNIRIIGSVARGQDRPGSDLDIIASFPPTFDLLDLMRVEAEVEAIVGIHVDVVADDPRTPWAMQRAKEEAVPL